MFNEIFGGLLKDLTLIGILVSFVGGWLLKKWPSFPNKFIPVATLIVSIITQFINFFTGHQVEVPTEPVAAMAPVFLQAGLFDSGLFKAVIAAVLQWVLTDKTYETQKKAMDQLTGKGVEVMVPVTAVK